jgi:hypothetical protein
MQFFLAGIMQGSHASHELHDQEYRKQLRALIEDAFPGADVYDPLADHRNSVEYEDATARDVFYRHNRLCREVDVVLAFVPEASMGTAIEMWEAHEHGRGVVVSISPLAKNWAIRYCSHICYRDLETFAADAKSGKLARRIGEVLGRRQGERSS